MQLRGKIYRISLYLHYLAYSISIINTMWSNVRLGLKGAGFITPFSYIAYWKMLIGFSQFSPLGRIVVEIQVG